MQLGYFPHFAYTFADDCLVAKVMSKMRLHMQDSILLQQYIIVS